MWLNVDLRKYIDGTMFVYAADPVNAPAILNSMGLSPTVNDPSTDALDVDNTIEGDSYGVGFNAALHYKISDEWSFGVSYRSQIKHHVKGDASFDPSPAASAIFGSNLFQDCDVSGNMSMPDMLSFGLMYKPYDNFSIEVGAMLTRWSTYNKLEFSFEELTAVGVSSSGEEKRWNDAWRFMIGAEYSPLDWLTLRLGYDYDQSPIEEGYEDYRLPSNDRHLFSGGVGLRFGEFTVDMSYTYLAILGRDVDERTDAYGFPSMYRSRFENGDAHIYALTLGYTF